MTRIRIRTISTETRIIYALWVCCIALTCVYVCLIAGTMVYGVDAKVARASTERLARTTADREAKLLAESSRVTVSDAYDAGLVAVAAAETTDTEIVLGRADR